MTVKLVPFTQEAFPSLLEWIDSPKMMVQWTGPVFFKHPLTEEQLLNYLKMSPAGTPPGNLPECYPFSVLNEKGILVGHIDLAMIQRENDSASVCRVLINPAERGKGYCQDMMNQLLAFGFGEMKMRRIDLRVYAFNKPALHCYLKAGFLQEGLMRKALRVEDEYWDTIQMAILKEEWDDLKG